MSVSPAKPYRLLKFDFFLKSKMADGRHVGVIGTIKKAKTRFFYILSPE